jgi:hypothetical protein
VTVFHHAFLSMVNPPPQSLRRRAQQLEAAAIRESAHDINCASLLLFYAAECGLKHVYMSRNNLKDTSEERGSAVSARSYGHDLKRLVTALNIPRASIGNAPAIVFRRSQDRGEVSVLHQAWRYGVEIDATDELYKWLQTITNWCRGNS